MKQETTGEGDFYIVIEVKQLYLDRIDPELFTKRSQSIHSDSYCSPPVKLLAHPLYQKSVRMRVLEAT